MKGHEDWIAIEYGDANYEVYIILYGQRFLLRGVEPVCEPLRLQGFMPRDDRYLYIDPNIKVELSLYRVPPPPPPPKRSWAKSMGLRRPKG